MLRSLPVLTAAILFFAAFRMNATCQGTAPGSSAQHKQVQLNRTMPQPINLQALPKDIAVSDLLALMRSYTAALGVECEFCHSVDLKTRKTDFASDANSDKAIARIMIRMTMEINEKFMAHVGDSDATPADKTVTCGTCHRGNSMPMPFATANKNAPHDHGENSGSKPD
jgi:hypothetical protein